ncbi:MAG: argininosuccinate lyase, partial [Planctomycetota bacterium]
MSKAKPWGGRFAKDTNRLVEVFTESISFDRQLARYDIHGSLAHVKMLAACGLIEQGERDRIETGLRGILEDIEAGGFEFDEKLEDVHMNIEAALAERIGPTAGKLHTARSRNDQVALDFRMWSRDRLDLLDEALAALQWGLVDRAEQDFGIVVPGFTHLQHAQPVLASHHWLAYVEMLARDRSRLADCRRRTNILPLGACALAGTTLPTDPAMVAGELGFEAVFGNSMDAVSDRDFVVEHHVVLSMIALHLSRLGEDIVLWSSTEFGLVVLPDDFATGSSIMPQKKNPDVAELVRGKTGRAVGNLVNSLVMLKGLGMTYNRDLQEDKLPLFESDQSVRMCLEVLAAMVPALSIDADRAAELCSKGFLDATSLADYFVEKGMPFRQAHEHIGRMVAECVEADCELSALPVGRFRQACPEAGEDVYQWLGADNAVRRNRTPGGTGHDSVKQAFEHW